MPSPAVDPSSPDQPPLSGGVAWSVIALYAILACWSTWHHEMWRDELQAWLLARDSANPFELAHRLRYEGHPGLWHYSLMVLSRITTAPVIMQVFHLLIAISSVYLVVRHSPLARWQKLLFPFGYYALYEYAVLARNYAIGAFLILLVCTLFARRDRWKVGIGIALFLLAHTNVQGTVVALAFAMTFAADLWWPGLLRAPGAQPVRRDQVGWLVVVPLIGVATALYLLLPAADVNLRISLRWVEDTRLLIRQTSQIIAWALLPVPEPNAHFWGTHGLDALPQSGKVQALVSLFILGWFALGLARKPTAWVFALAGTLGPLAFFMVTRVQGSVRHHGYIWFVLLAAVWIERSCREWTAIPATGTAYRRWRQSVAGVLGAVLTMQIVAAAIALPLEYRYPFSNAKAASAFIEAQGLRDLRMVGHEDFTASAIVGILDVPSMFYPRAHRYGSYVIWDMARAEPVSDAEVWQDARNLAGTPGPDVLLILNAPPKADMVGDAVPLASFTGSVLRDEDFFLYRIKASPVR